MSFNIGLSGLRGAQMDLSVTGNNIANASTVGFKQSRAEFGDVYAASILGTGKNSTGSGVLVERIFQQHTQGNIDYTDNALDLAINGNGYFIISDNGQTQYTRAGYFGLDKEGYIVNNTGKRLQGYEADLQGNIQTGALGDVRLSQTNVEPNATSQIGIEFNLDAREDIPQNVFDPSDATTYNYANSTTIYDSLGNPHVLRQYFVKVEPGAGHDGNAWNVINSMDGKFFPNDGSFDANNYVTLESWPDFVDADGNPTGDVVGDVGFELDGYVQSTLFFNQAGGLVDAREWSNDYPGSAAVGLVPSGAGANTPRFNLDLAGIVEGANFGPAPGTNVVDFRLLGTTQYGARSAVQSQSQDGYTTGRLAGLEVSQDGTIFGRYTNGQNRAIGQIPIATFTSPESLKPIGSNAWVETYESGIPTVNMAGSGITGTVEGGALESSNVDLSEQLVKMIIAQRNFQANAKTIQTQDTLTQTVINLR